MDSEIYQKIPHRPPFLWLDKIIQLDDQQIEAEKYISPDLELFKGHYPDYPIMPGVILCEAVFQAGALLISEMLAHAGEVSDGVPVLTRIYGARFKRQVRPGDTIRVRAALKEKLGPAWLMNGKVILNNKTAVAVEFGCTLADFNSD